jgi:hypothetical protein
MIFFLIDTNVITEGETSDEFYFYTLLSSPPSSLECETLYNQMDLTWNNPTNGLDSGTSYEYSYSVTDSKFIIYSKALRCTFFGEWKNSRSSKIVQLWLLNKAKART